MTFKFPRGRVALFGLGLLSAALPYSLNVQDAVSIGASHAQANEAGGNKGNSGGNGNGNGNGSSGNGNGSNGGGNGTGQSSGKSTSQGSASGKSANTKSGATIERSGRNISVRHRNGMQESIVGIFYEMKDAKGRRIVKRAATSKDRARLSAIAG